MTELLHGLSSFTPRTTAQSARDDGDDLRGHTHAQLLALTGVSAQPVAHYNAASGLPAENQGAAKSPFFVTKHHP